MSLSQKQRQIRKIEPARPSYFDDQFWPVSVALCLTTAIAVGAAVSLLSGPWMWASLIAMPITMILALFTLHQIQHRFFRRSLQIAVVLSAAIHLLMLIVCGLTSIFGSYQPTQKVSETKQPAERVMLVSQRDPNPIWRELNRRENSDPELESEREPTRVDPTPPQPVEVERAKPTDSPQANRSTKESQSVPHLDQSLSQLRKSDGAEQLKSQAPAAAGAAAPARRRETNPESSETSANRTDASASRPSTTTEPAEMVRRDQTESMATRNNSEVKQASASEAAATTARTANREVEIPHLAAVEPNSIPTESPQTRPTTVARERTAETAKAEQPVRELQPSELPSPTVSRNEQNQSAQATRRDLARNQPSLTQENSPQSEPRRSRMPSERIASTVPLEAPSNAATSTSGAVPQPQSASTSLTRGDSQSALADSARNLQADTNRADGAAAVASDSAARRRTESAENLPASLTAQQSSIQRRSQADSPTPQSAWQSNSELAATIGGARQTAVRSTESSAATADSASDSERGPVSAEAGSSQMDFGPTKLMADSAAQRSSGGGASAIGTLDQQPSSLARSSNSAQSSSLLASNIEPTQALRASPSQSTVNGELQPESAALNTTRSGGTNNRTGDPHMAELAGQPSDFAAVTGTDSLAGASRRDSNSKSSKLEVDGKQADDAQRGNSRSGISRAPESSVDVRLADDEGTAQGNGSTPRPSAGDAKLAERAAARGTGAFEAEVADAESGSGRGAELNNSSQRRSRNPGSELTETASANSRGRRGTERSTLDSQVEVDGDADADGLSSVGKMAKGRTEANEAEALDSNRIGQSTQLDVIAEDGPAGLGLKPDDALGVNSRPASRNSRSLQLAAESRFNRSDSGAAPATATDAVIAKEAFDSRGQPGNGREPSTEAAIENGLEFLARHQRPGGSWVLGAFDVSHPQHRYQFNSDSAATGLALLAFQGAGYTHREFKYASQMQRAIDWLIEIQEQDGCLFVAADDRSNGNCRMYSHAIATLALTEAYGMTQDNRLREPCRRALAYIANTQHEQGGWRYYAERSMRQSDTSVTGWMMMAMQSGRLVDLDLPEATWDGIESWLDGARDPQDESRFRYNPFASESAQNVSSQGRLTTPSMTSVGLLMRLYLGWDRNDQRLLAGADYLLQKQLPGEQNQAQRDTYYWYYATQVLRHIGGERWEKWHAKLHPLLVNSQVKSGPMSGSWNPYEPVLDRWGPTGGRLYVTTMNLLSLEVNYRLLPLYDKTSR